MKVKFLGNNNAPHLRTWLNIYQAIYPDLKVNLDTVHPTLRWNFGKLRVLFLSGFIPMIFKYVLLGVFERFCSDADYLHAHSASGYGLVAYLSGRKYFVTVYGSEVLLMKQKSNLYQRMIKKIIENAELVTCTSPEVENFLKLEGFDAEIVCFHTGFSPEFVKQFEQIKMIKDKFAMSNDKVHFVSNRNCAPNYNIKEIVEAWIESDYCEKGLLTILTGSYDVDYLAEIMGLISSLSSVEIIDKYLSQEEIFELMLRADVVISIPDSDQLGTSVLEALALNNTVVLSELIAYKSVFNDGAQVISVAKNELVDLLGKGGFVKKKEYKNDSFLKRYSVENSALHFSKALEKALKKK